MNSALQQINCYNLSLQLVWWRRWSSYSVAEFIRNSNSLKLLKPRGAVVAEAQVLAQVAGHLRQDLPAPVDLDGSLVGSVDQVVAQRPGEQDVGVREHD